MSGKWSRTGKPGMLQSMGSQRVGHDRASEQKQKVRSLQWPLPTPTLTFASLISPWRRKWQPIPVFLPGKFHGQRSLADHGPWGSQKIVRHNWRTNISPIPLFHALPAQHWPPWPLNYNLHLPSTLPPQRLYLAHSFSKWCLANAFTSFKSFLNLIEPTHATLFNTVILRGLKSFYSALLFILFYGTYNNQYYYLFMYYY